ncbi:MAG: gliding motility-associated C-terminal domain-containing protein [Lewinellaceae bacterium]|nr:gliding motility-associated C-terminal domain-containing protein [Lewinellaceae bacterium]
MTNRLHRHFLAVPALLVFCFSIFPFLGLIAQPGFFNFTPPAQTTINVGPTCSASMADSLALPTVTSTVGANITMSMLDTSMVMWEYDDLWTAPTLNIVVPWLVKDDQGHMHTFMFTVSFVDATPPVFDLMGTPPTASYGSIVQVPLPPNITATDCTPVTVTYVQSTPPDTCAAGVFTRTWTAKDTFNNTSVFTQTITISADILPPVIAIPPQNGSAPCEQLASAYPAWLAQQMSIFSANDVSGIKSYTNNGPAAFPPGCAVPLTVTFRATDNCNLFTTATAVFTTSDNKPPVIPVAPMDTVAYCSPGGDHLTKLGEWISAHAFLEAHDSCSQDSFLTYTMQMNGTPSDSAQVVAAFLASYANGCDSQLVGSQWYGKVRGTVLVNFFVTDACGNQAVAGQAMFGAIDTLPPVLNGSNTVEQCGSGDDDASLQAWINLHGNASVSDDCSSTTWTDFSYTTSDGQSGNGSFGSGPYPPVQAFNCNWYADVTFRATDDCGNIGSLTLRFQIQDNEMPVISGFPDTVTLSCPNPVPVMPAGFITDNCDSSMVVDYTFTTSDTLCPGSYTMHVTWSATDDCGNTGTATQTVLVRDTQGPLFTLVPPPDTMRCDTFMLPPDAVMGVDIDAADNCSQVTGITTQVVSMQDPDPANCGHYSYDIIRTFTATDECGNTSTTTQVIRVIDNLGPMPGGLIDTTIVCEVQPVLPPPSPVDACSGATDVPVFINETVTAGPCDDSYTLTRFWQAEDVCGNTSVIEQLIHVQDTVAPVLSNIPADVTVECDAIPDPPDPSIFDADDNCDEDVTIVLSESEIRDPDTMGCAHWTNYILVRTWTASDNCGNTKAYTQHINIQDNTGPVIVTSASVNFPSDQGFCGAEVAIPAPVSLYDECTSLKSLVALKDTALLQNTSGGPNGTTPVDTIVFQWPAPNIPPGSPVLGNAVLTVYLDVADAEGMEEYLRIYGENNFQIGQTVNTPFQCGNSVTTLNIAASLLNAWLTDGQLTLTLAPAGTGSGAINALATCVGSRVRVELTYTVTNQQVPITLTYTLDGDTTGTYPPSDPFFLDVGMHTVVYTATDCAGNSSTASTTLVVDDVEPPSVTPPASFTAYTGINNCEATVLLPFPAITDNCDVSGNINQQSGLLPIQFENDPNAGLIPKDIILNLSNLIPNAISGGTLRIRHKGDNDNSLMGEFFSIYDENSALVIPATTSGLTAEECIQFHETSITVTANQINAWAADGAATFTAVANDDAGNFTDFIDPCTALLPDMTDGVSRLQAILEYSYAVVTYEIRNSMGQLVKSGSLNGGQTSEILGPGTYNVKYLVQDINGLEGMASYTITVLDTVAPSAQCKSLTIFTNPSGTQPYVLQPSEIDNGSVDNCSGTNLTYQLSQTMFNCNQAGSSFNVVMTVTDTSGNSSTCTALVGVATSILTPTYTPVCEGGTLKLFVDPPGNDASYTYKWSGPNGYMSTVQNPMISPAQLSNEGTYCVTVTGLTACTATGCVTVDLVNLPTQPVISANGTSFCAGNNVVLATPTYSGQNVSYQWYADSLPAPVLLGTTSTPIFNIVQPPVGVYRYFVKVLADGCTSVNSNLLTVTVYPKPVATVDQTFLNPCECVPISLGTPVQGPGIKYMWTGPGGFMDTSQYPLVTTCAVTSIHEGTYTLIIKQNGCSSDPVNVVVDVRDKPATPQLAGATQVCEGATVTLIATFQPGVDSFLWQSPSLSTISTANNSLVLNNVMLADSGSWRVRIVKQGCYSDWSAPAAVQVQAYPDVAGSANTPVCQGATLQLSATSDVPLPNWCWTGPNNFVRFEQNPAVTPAVAGTYKVVGKTSFGCADSTFVDVVVATPPVITSVTNNAPVCADGSAATLQAVVVTQNGPVTYSWTGPMNFSSPDSMPVIPNVNATQNGTYVLKVTDIYGCMSAPKSTVINIQDPPVTPILASTPPIPTVCAGADVTISISNSDKYPPTGTIYTWLVSNGNIVATTQPFLTISNAQVSDMANYMAIAGVAGCISDTSAPVFLTVYPIPPTPVPTSNSPVCEGDTLKLSTQLVPGASYIWTGPAGWTASVRNPVIPNVTMSQAGNYNVYIIVNGCASDQGEGINVQVKKRPKQPNLLPASAVCLEQPGATLTLQVFPGSADTGAMYTWYYGLTMAPIGGPGFPITFQTSNLSPYPPGPNQFYVVATKNGCSSFASNLVTVNFDTIPASTAFIGTEGPACAAQPLTLTAAQLPGGSTGKWTQIGTPPVTIVNPNNDTTLVTGLSAGNTYQFAWTLSNGGCKNYSSDTVSILAFAPEQAMVTVSMIDTCFAESIELNAIQGTTVNGYWTQPPGQIDLGFHIVDPLEPGTIADSLSPGNTLFYFWNLDNGACGISTATVTVRNFGAIANAGADQVLCRNDSCTDLTAAQPPTGEFGRWHSINDPTLVFASPNSPNTTVCNLKRGINRVYWETNNGFCGDKSRDTVVIVYDLFPTAVPDTFEVQFGEKIDFSVLLNDILPQQFDVSIDDEPDFGNFTQISEGVYSYQPNVTFSGEDVMIYKICNLVCPEPACSTAVVTLLVGEVGGCEIFNLITPNDDNVNDEFFVPCLEGDGGIDNEVTIFNQYGDVVFHAKPYNNDWKGTYNGQELPAGTYFYVVKFNQDTKPRKGFLQIQR